MLFYKSVQGCNVGIKPFQPILDCIVNQKTAKFGFHFQQSPYLPAMSGTRIITKTIWRLSLISLFTDMASEMLYPVVPLYLKQAGYTMVAIGLLEGISEAIAGLCKGYFGAWSDGIKLRTPFIKVGYTISTFSKLLIALLPSLSGIFSARIIDRLGKGIRSAPRDALLAQEASPENRSAVFGFHRAMDTLGAVAGPSIAAVFLLLYPENYTTLFWIAAIPGIVVMLIFFGLRERNKGGATKVIFPSWKNFLNYYGKSDPRFKKHLLMFLLFTLFNSSDVFLLLKVKETGAEDGLLLMLYIIYNAVYALSAWPAGILADKWGIHRILSIGFLCFTITYAAFGFASNLLIFTLLFIIYGLYAAAIETQMKTYLLQFVDVENRGTAIGLFTGFQSISLLFASLLAGVVWQKFGAIYIFLPAAVIAAVLFLYFFKAGQKGKK